MINSDFHEAHPFNGVHPFTPLNYSPNLNNLVPFTEFDGNTLLREFNSLVNWVRKVLQQLDNLPEEWKTKVSAAISELETAKSQFANDLSDTKKDLTDSVEKFKTDTASANESLRQEIERAKEEVDTQTQAQLDSLMDRLSEAFQEQIGLIDTRLSSHVDGINTKTGELPYRRISPINDRGVGQTVDVSPIKAAGQLDRVFYTANGDLVPTLPVGKFGLIDRRKGAVTKVVFGDDFIFTHPQEQGNLSISDNKKIVSDESYSAFSTAESSIFKNGEQFLIAFKTSPDHVAEGKPRIFLAKKNTLDEIPAPLRPNGKPPKSHVSIAAIPNGYAVLFMEDQSENRQATYAIFDEKFNQWQPFGLRTVDFTGLDWSFPSDIYWVRETNDLLISAYGQNGVAVTIINLESGLTKHTMIVNTPGEWPFSESSFFRDNNNVIHCALRYEKDGRKEIYISKSTDLGFTWEPPRKILDGYSGFPAVTTLKSGRQVLTLRDSKRSDVWAVAHSFNSVDWDIIPLPNLGWNMYGKVIETNFGIFLVGSSQHRGDAGRCDTWIVEVREFGKFPKHDTGWLDIKLNSGFEAAHNTLKPQYRVIDGLVYLRGYVKRSDGSKFSSLAEQIFTLPPVARPSMEARGLVGASPTSTATPNVNLTISAAGIASAYRSGTGETDRIFLTGLPPYLNN